MSEPNYGFIQVFEDKYLCGIMGQNPPQTWVLVTGELSQLKKSGVTDNLYASQRKLVTILGIYHVPMNMIKDVFRCAKNKVLDVVIQNQTITIIGDNGVILNYIVTTEAINDVSRREIILAGTVTWLKINGLETF